MSFQGKVKLYKADKGFGFITAKDGTDVFLLGRFCVDGGVPQKGDVVRYDVEPSTVDPKKFQAINVTGGTGVSQNMEEPSPKPRTDPCHAGQDSLGSEAEAGIGGVDNGKEQLKGEGAEADDATAEMESDSDAGEVSERPCAGGFGSIRSAYGELGSGGYYQAHGEDYTNPHEPALRRSLVAALEAWESQLELPLRRAHDLACGSGEATLAFSSWPGCAGCALDASDPYTHAAFENRLGRPCRRWSFEDIAAGVMEEEQPYDLVLASFCLHLLEKSYLRTTLAALARSCRRLVVATPHKRPEIEASTGWRLLSELVQERVRVRLYASDGARRLDEGETIALSEFDAVCSLPREQEGKEDADIDDGDVEERVARMSTEELRAAVVERGLSTAGTKGEVAARLVVAMREEQDVDDANGEGKGEEEEEDIEELIASMNLAALRAALADHGLSTEGKRAQLAERLLLAMVEEQEESVEELVEAMSTAQLRSALAARGLETSGKRSDLVARLLEAMRDEDEDEEMDADQDEDTDEGADADQRDGEARDLSRKDKKKMKEQRKREKEQKAQAAAKALEEKKLRENEKRKERRKNARQHEVQEESEKPIATEKARLGKKQKMKARVAEEEALLHADSGKDSGAEGGAMATGAAPEGGQAARSQRPKASGASIAERFAGVETRCRISSRAICASENYFWADPLPSDCAEALLELGVAPGARVSDVELSGIMAEGGPDAALACGLLTVSAAEAVPKRNVDRGQQLEAVVASGSAGSHVWANPLTADTAQAVVASGSAGSYMWANPLPADTAQALAEMGVVPGARVSDVEMQGILAEGGPEAALACGLIREAAAAERATFQPLARGSPARCAESYRWACPLPADSATALGDAGVVAGALLSEVEMRGILSEGGPEVAISCGLIQRVAACP